MAFNSILLHVQAQRRHSILSRQTLLSSVQRSVAVQMSLLRAQCCLLANAHHHHLRCDIALRRRLALQRIAVRIITT